MSVPMPDPVPPPAEFSSPREPVKPRRPASGPNVLQARLADNTPWYSANRDLSHCFKFILGELARRVSKDPWPAAAKILADAGVPPEKQGEAISALVRFTAGCTRNNNMLGQLEESGWFELPEEVHLAILGTIGQIVLGIAWSGMKEATIGGAGPAKDMKTLFSEGRRATLQLRAGRWGLFRRRWLGRVRRFWRLVWGIKKRD